MSFIHPSICLFYIFFVYICRQKAQIYSILFRIITLSVKRTLVVVVRKPQPTQLRLTRILGGIWIWLLSSALEHQQTEHKTDTRPIFRQPICVMQIEKSMEYHEHRIMCSVLTHWKRHKYSTFGC